MRVWRTDDTERFKQGIHHELHDVLGAHSRWTAVAQMTRFALWCPGTDRVCVVGDFNDWTTGAHPLQRIEGTDVWQGDVQGTAEGQLYKFRFRTADGTWHERSDPFARACEASPGTASRLTARRHRWRDAPWRKGQAQAQPWKGPISIYELHLGSWMSAAELPEGPLYRTIADPLIAHIKRLGFTHVEFMPVMEHPYTPSWGYQVTGYFAPTARHGSGDDLRYLVDRLHRAGIGVILDWVPAHFPTDGHALYRWGGQAVFEHPDPRLGWHNDWTTAIFDFGRPEVRSFLLSSAYHWLDSFHADGLRVDAVASMLYRDYSRADGEWLPNEHGGRENLQAISLLRELNELVGRTWPHKLMFAEESTAFPGVSHPVHHGGLGFGFKWDMGWMNDTLRYLERDPIHRKHHHHELTFRSVYQHTENFVLPLSHDEVVHGKGSLLRKMPGDPWQARANLRLLLATQYAQPGKKLLFMGAELAPDTEWNVDHPLPWHLQDDPDRRGIGLLIGALNRIYRAQAALQHGDTDAAGFAWIDGSDQDQSVVTYLRRTVSADDTVLVAAHYTPSVRHGYRIGVPHGGAWKLLLNTDDPTFGGSGIGCAPTVTAQPVPYHGQPFSLQVDLPPLGALFLHGGDHA